MFNQSLFKFAAMTLLPNTHKTLRQVNGSILNWPSLAWGFGSTQETLMLMCQSQALSDGLLSWRTSKESQSKSLGDSGGFLESISTRTRWQEWYGSWEVSALCQWKAQVTWCQPISPRRHKLCSNLLFPGTTSPTKVHDPQIKLFLFIWYSKTT